MKKIVGIVLIFFSFTATVTAKEVIRFASAASYPPFELLNEKNELTGFDIDIAKSLCDVMQVKCTFTNQVFDGLIPALKFRRFDAAISAIDVTKEREKQVTFTDTYYQNSAIIVAHNHQFSGIEQLKNKRVGVQNGTTHQKYLKDRYPEINLVAYESYQTAIMDLNSKRLDAVFGDSATVKEWIKNNSELVMVGDKITDPDYFGIGFAIAVRHGNTELRDRLNHALAEIKANGTYEQLTKKWSFE